MAEQAKQKEFDITLLPEISDIMNFQPVGQRTIIKPDTEYALVTKGGIYMPDNKAEERRKTTLSKGEIISMGELVDSTRHQVGQQVYFYWHEGDGMLRTPDDTIYIVLPEYSIRGYVIDNTKEQEYTEMKNIKAAKLIIGQS